MIRMLVDQKDITRTCLDVAPQVDLDDGQLRLQIDSFALTANNVTYAASGFSIGYWDFFPSGVAGQGIVPVWGTAQVSESRCEGIETGARFYGFFPLAQELVITARRGKNGVVQDVAPHRAALPAVYNRYIPTPANGARNDHLRALLQPLLATSWLLSDWLADNAFFGATQVIVGSASSKTGLGLCRYLAENTTRGCEVIGLTSAGNKAFVEGAGVCDKVITYQQVEDLPQVGSVYVDMAGNAAVKHALHTRLGDQLKHSAAVGISHWDQFAPPKDLPGIKPQFFFAPAQIAKRREEWGPGVVERKIDAAWQRVADTSDSWLQLRIHKGFEAAQAVYADLAQGRACPRDGHVITL